MNKLLLAAIALGLWANAATTFVRPARADLCECQNELVNVEQQILNLKSQLHSDLQDIESAITNK